MKPIVAIMQIRSATARALKYIRRKEVEERKTDRERDDTQTDSLVTQLTTVREMKGFVEMESSSGVDIRYQFSKMDEDNEVGLPQKGLNMIMKDAIPEMRIANESREIFNNCCVEFIKYISREAQQISGNDQRKTIYHEHVQKALQNLKFPMDYIEAADSVLDECKEAAEKRLKRKNSRLDKCGIPEDQLYELQQQLIQKRCTKLLVEMERKAKVKQQREEERLAEEGKMGEGV
ncbi:hypothetical protein WR25_10405 [Diploscapter pachys]|uniref:Protein Dr1 n=1 Tax=Diploscapter pachys TaxID=2018661 RepID=A0A2A2J8Q4_9BILA|nr:hypothetical protein WR25_10405 [Diploscapter pachys]